jgi:hypothetical protein
MQADEFARMFKPEKAQSRLAPYLPDLMKLRAENYTLEQLNEFLKLNGVTISTSGLQKYLQRQTMTPGKKTAPDSKSATQKSARLEAVEPDSETPVTASSNPADLDKIFNTRVDLYDLARKAKAIRRAK